MYGDRTIALGKDGTSKFPYTDILAVYMLDGITTLKEKLDAIDDRLQTTISLENIEELQESVDALDTGLSNTNEVIATIQDDLDAMKIVVDGIRESILDDLTSIGLADETNNGLLSKEMFIYVDELPTTLTGIEQNLLVAIDGLAEVNTTIDGVKQDILNNKSDADAKFTTVNTNITDLNTLITNLTAAFNSFKASPDIDCGTF